MADAAWSRLLDTYAKAFGVKNRIDQTLQEDRSDV